MIRIRRRAAAVPTALALVAIAGCGTRVSHADVVKAAGGGPVIISSGAPASSGSQPSSGTPLGAGSTSAPNGTSATTSGSGSSSTGTTSIGGTGTSSNPNSSTGSTTTKSSGGSTTGKSGSNNSSSTTSGSGSSASTTCTHQGSPIVFGQVGTFSGIIGASEGSAAPGLKIWQAATNAAGGIDCHPVVVDSIDDGGSAGQAQSAVETLIQKDHAVAINAFVPVTLNGIENVVDNAHVPVVGGDGLANQWTTDPNFYSAGTSFESVIYGFLKRAADLNHHKYSFMYCIEATPCTAAQAYVTKKGLAKKAGLTGVGDQPISLAQSSFVQQCATAKSKGADIVIIGAGATAVSAVGRDCASQNYHPLYITESLAAINSLDTNPNLNGLTIGLTSFPWMETATPAERAYQAAIKQFDPSLDNGGGAADAWTDGQLLKAAIESLGKKGYGTITPALVIEGLHNIKNNNLGGLAPGELNFSHGGNTAPDKCSFIASISHGKWVAPIGNNQICGP